MNNQLRRFYFILVLLFFDLNAARSQNDSDAQVVEFNLTDNKFKSSVPFDVPFMIEFTHVVSTVNSLSIKIYELEDEGKSKKTILDTLWMRAMDDGSTVVDFPVISRLAPNKDYVVSIKAGTIRNLDAGESSYLEGYLKTHSDLDGVINKIVNKYVKDSMAPLKDLSGLLIELNQKAQAAVKRQNEQYELHIKDLVPALTALAQFTATGRDINTGLLELQSALVRVVPPPTNDIKLFAPYSDVNKIDIAALSSGTDKYREFLAVLDTIKTHQNKIIPHATAITPSASAVVTITGDLTNTLGDLIAAKGSLVDAVVKLIIVKNTMAFQPIVSTYSKDLSKNASLYFAGDIGGGYGTYPDWWFTYSGFSIYFRPLTKSLPLSKYKGVRNVFASRASFLFGITLNSVAKENIRKGIVGNSALVCGLGFRLTPWFKINGGTLIYRSFDTNPTVSHENDFTTFSPFFAASIDIDVKDLFGSIFK